MTETAEKCRTSRRPSRPAVEAWRRYSQAQGMWPWSKGNLDHDNAVRRVGGPTQDDVCSATISR